MHFNDSFPDLKTAQDIGLKTEEYDRIKKILNRVPNFTELSIFSVIWSVGFAAKNAHQWFTASSGENKHQINTSEDNKVGLIKIDDDLACAFTLGTVSFSSKEEAYQTTINGISRVHRAIFTTGARPVAALHALRFGNISTKQNQSLVNEVADGISNYSEHFGVPAVGGDVYFYDSFNQNITINTLSAGIIKKAETISAKAEGTGNPIFIVGAPTQEGMIPKMISPSAIIVENDNEEVPAASPKRTTFPEKLLPEAILEAVKSGAIAGMQDIEMAGIAGTAASMCSNFGTGMRIDLDKVVRSESSDVRAFEIALSESPGRILVVGEKGKENLLLDIFAKWDLPIAQIGEVTDDAQCTYYQNNEQVAKLPAQALVSIEHPVFSQDTHRPAAYFEKIRKFNPGKVKKPADYPQTAWKVFSSPNIASKKWIHELCVSKGQADSLKPKRTADAAIIKIEESSRCLAIAVNGNSAYIYADPYIGAMIAIGEAARNIVCSGGEPVAVSVCMNFGDPQDPEVQWQFNQATRGIGEACRKFGIAIANSSLFFRDASGNEEPAGSIYPAPTIGMIGLLNNYDTNTSLHFKQEKHQIYMIGTPQNDLGSSEYLRVIHGIPHSPAPNFDLDEEIHIQRNLKKIFKKGFIESAHDISEGGLFVCLIECAIPNNLGFEIETDGNFRKDAYLFGESQSRIIVTTKEENEDELVNYLNSNNVPFSKLGEVVGKNAIIDKKNYGAISKWKAFYDNFMANTLKND